MNLVLGITGATGAYAAQLLIEKAPWPVTLVVSEWGREVCKREGISLDLLSSKAGGLLDDKDLAASISSGSVPTVGMVILPCTTNTLGKVACGLSDTLITRAAHCHLKERRPAVFCVRESPWTLIDIENARKVAAAGGVVMPMSPPFYMKSGDSPETVTMKDLLDSYVDRVLAVLKHPPEDNWETIS